MSDGYIELDLDETLTYYGGDKIKLRDGLKKGKMLEF